MHTFSIVYPQRGKVVALNCVDNVRDYPYGRRLVEQGMVA
jgi:hypothetical protein